MTEIRQADPAARRQAVFIIVLVTIAGALALAAFNRYRIPLEEWVTSPPDEVAHRARLVLLVVTLATAGPLLAMALYLWTLGARICRTQEFPPPGVRLMHDTVVRRGPLARSRGRALQFVALVLALAAAGLSVLLWWLAGILGVSMD